MSENTTSAAALPGALLAAHHVAEQIVDLLPAMPFTCVWTRGAVSMSLQGSPITMTVPALERVATRLDVPLQRNEYASPEYGASVGWEVTTRHSGISITISSEHVQALSAGDGLAWAIDEDGQRAAFPSHEPEPTGYRWATELDVQPEAVTA